MSLISKGNVTYAVALKMNPQLQIRFIGNIYKLSTVFNKQPEQGQFKKLNRPDTVVQWRNDAQCQNCKTPLWEHRCCLKHMEVIKGLISWDKIEHIKYQD